MQLPTIDSYTLLWLEWSIGSISVFISGLLVINYSDFLPNFINRIVKYGKSADGHDKLKFLELPKRYFFHFYSLALFFYLVLSSLAINIYFNLNLLESQRKTSFLSKVLDRFAGYYHHTSSYQRTSSVSPESVLIGLMLLTFQVSRRLYECKMVSVYSNAQMNIVHYMFGHLFYIGVGLSMLADAPGFTGQAASQMTFKPNKFEFFTPNHMIGVILFLLSSYIQFDSHRILANLRKDTTGRVISTKHSIPHGKWFDLVSSPHYMAEILIYLAITIVLGGKSQTWWMVFLFVVTNQVFVGMFNHSWYQKTFKDYPKSRRAIIPYVL